MCRAPLKCHERSTCALPRNCARAELFRQAKLLVIDEVTMGHRHLYEAIDRSLRDVRRCPNKPFGGLTVLFSGDWKQILPVCVGGGRAEIVNSTLKASTLWQSVQVLTLQRNMRVQNAGGVDGFATFLRDLGTADTENSEYGEYMSCLSNNFRAPHGTSLHTFCRRLFPRRHIGANELLHVNHDHVNFLAANAIICPTNRAAEQVNNIVMGNMHSE